MKRIGNKKTIYITFGGTGFSEKLFISLIKSFLNSGFFVIASGGVVVDLKKISIKSENLLLEKFLPGMSASYLADVVVSHGSYGTIMQAVLNGKPVICIPFNFTQFLNSIRVTELGIGFSTFKWKLDNYLSVNSSKFQSGAEIVEPDLVVRLIQETLANPKYKQNVLKFRKKIGPVNGATRAARIIEKELD